MPALKAFVVRVVDEAQPGWVECRFTDADGVEHVVVENAPVVADGDALLEGRFPVPALLECVVLGPASAGMAVRVDIDRPWGLQSDAGLTEFRVEPEQLVPRVFVSCPDIDAAEPQVLLAALRARGCLVFHSPRHPDAGPDARWTDWYERGLQQALTGVDAFVIVPDTAWDSSTWMAEEARQALDVLRVRHPFFWSPKGVSVRAMGDYLRTRLPADPVAAANIVTGVDLGRVT